MGKCQKKRPLGFACLLFRSVSVAVAVCMRACLLLPLYHRHALNALRWYMLYLFILCESFVVRPIFFVFFLFAAGCCCRHYCSHIAIHIYVWKTIPHILFCFVERRKKNRCAAHIECVSIRPLRPSNIYYSRACARMHELCTQIIIISSSSYLSLFPSRFELYIGVCLCVRSMIV